MTLLFGRKFYTELGYNGLVRGGLGLENAQGRSVRKIVPMAAPDNTYPDSRPVTLESTYIWSIEADTHQLSDDDWMKQYFITQMRRSIGISATKTWRVACLRTSSPNGRSGSGFCDVLGPFASAFRSAGATSTV